MTGLRFCFCLCHGAAERGAARWNSVSALRSAPLSHSTKYPRFANRLITSKEEIGSGRGRFFAASAVYCRTSEVEAQFDALRARRHKMSSAEGGKEVVEGVFVGYVDSGQLQADFVLIAVE